MNITKLKEKRYKKAMNIKHNNLSREERSDYDCNRKNGLVKVLNTRADLNKKKKKIKIDKDQKDS